MRAGWGIAAVIAACGVFGARDARAGGLYFPDNGAQGLSRGGAFTAKADDATAILYNVAGLARQRGTHLSFSGNFQFHDFGFTRAGNYPDPIAADTPWGPAPYFTVKNATKTFFLPFAAVTTDFGYFDRFTAGISVYGPPAVGNRTFPLGIAGYPSPARYDYAQSKTSLIFPTLSAAFRVTDWLDIGANAQLVMLDLTQTTVSYIDQMPGACGYNEHYICDGRTEITAKGTTATGTFGIMARPVAAFAAGLNVQGPAKIRASGTAVATPPVLTSSLKFDPGTADIEVKLPWVIRAGARYVNMQGAFERFDVELDGVLETWGGTGAGPHVTIPKLGPYSDIDTVVLHEYDNTLSGRLGAAYNVNLTDAGVVTFRAGGFYETSATPPEVTRVDYDTLAKLAGTVGVGYKYSFVNLHVGYAAVRSLPRTVDNGVIRPINGATHGSSLDSSGNALPVVNNGHYFGFTHVLTLGIDIAFDTIFGKTRKSSYGDPSYEDLAIATPQQVTTDK